MSRPWCCSCWRRAARAWMSAACGSRRLSGCSAACWAARCCAWAACHCASRPALASANSASARRAAASAGRSGSAPSASSAASAAVRARHWRSAGATRRTRSSCWRVAMHCWSLARDWARWACNASTLATASCQSRVRTVAALRALSARSRSSAALYQARSPDLRRAHRLSASAARLARTAPRLAMPAADWNSTWPMSSRASSMALPPATRRLWSRPNMPSKKARSAPPRNGASAASGRGWPVLAQSRVLLRALVRTNARLAAPWVTVAPSRMSALACTKSIGERSSMPYSSSRMALRVVDLPASLGPTMRWKSCGAAGKSSVWPLNLP